MALEEDIATLDALCGDSLPGRFALRKLARAAQRGRRLSSTTLPAVAGLAQHAVAARDQLDALTPLVDPAGYDRLLSARTHLVAMLEALSAGTEGDPDDTGRVG